MTIRRKRIEEITRKILESLSITSPAVEIEKVAAIYGLDIKREALKSDISGFLYNDNSVSLIGVNSDQAEVRQRFTIAHEIGHHLLHRKPISVDRTFQANFRNELSKQGIYEEEIEANYFAASILMPKNFIDEYLRGKKAEVGSCLEDDAFLYQMATDFKVSVQSLVLRLNSLDYLSH